MYEPIRTKSVHSTMAGTTPDFPHRSREEELDIQLAGHLAALLAVTDELRGAAPSEELDTAAERLAAQVARLRGGHPPVRAVVAGQGGPSSPSGRTGRTQLAGLHRRAHALAGRALVVAASRADTAAAILAAEQMDVHTAALEPRELASHCATGLPEAAPVRVHPQRRADRAPRQFPGLPDGRSPRGGRSRSGDDVYVGRRSAPRHVAPATAKTRPGGDEHMARVAVITAPNIGYRNTGMLSVDLAFETLRRRMGPGIDATWYTLHVPETVPLRAAARGNGLPFRFHPLHEHLDELRDHDAVVFWGDFLHTRHYMAQDATNRLMDFGIAEDRDAARTLLNRTLLLSDQPDEVLARTLSYGGTILHNSQSDYEDKEFGPLFTRLMTRSHRVWMRDPLSAAKVALLRGDRTNEYFASDAALLSRPGDLDHLAATPWSQEVPDGGAIGVFLGARTTIPDWLPAFCECLSERFGAPLEWLPWFDRDIPPQAAHLALRPGEHTVGDLLRVLPRYRLVITDTYHLCVNAWGAGTPVVCVGAPEPVPRTHDDYWTLSEVKKHVFHLAYDAEDFYLSTLADTREAHAHRAEQIVRLVEGGGAEAVAARLRTHADRSATDFTGTLSALLAGR